MPHKDPEARKAYLARWNTTNRARIKAQRKTYRAANRDRLIANDKAYYEAHKEERKVQDKAYRQANAPAIKAREKAKRQRNRAKRLAYHKAYYEKNKEKLLAQAAEYKRTHPEVPRAGKAKRRALKKGSARNDFTAAQWKAMQEAFDHRCAYCNKRCKGRLTQDHITPLTEGGEHTAFNIVPACRSCNARKQTGPVLAPVQPLLIIC